MAACGQSQAGGEGKKFPASPGAARGESNTVKTDAQYARLDRAHLWHPYTRFSALEAGPLPLIERGRGIYLFDRRGRRYLDAVASWWACSLGHGNPRLVRAIRAQAGRLQHSILGNLSHPPAVDLAAQLARLMPSPGRHAFFSSDGACAVEAALKIAVQYHGNEGRPRRTEIVSLSQAYHGDTLGAVSAGFLEEFHRAFTPLLFPVHRLDPAGADPAAALRRLFKTRGPRVAALIVEPLCRGSAGMLLTPPAVLRELARECRRAGVLLIVDEIATGMGRTGRMFAFEHAGIDPDIVCVGKGLTGGCLPLSATVVKDRIYRAFSDRPRDGTFYHGHTFGGNPIAAACALEALKIYREKDIVGHVARLAPRLAEWLAPLKAHPGVKDVRTLGLMGAVELHPAPAGRPAHAAGIRRALLARGILVRPLGEVLYLMPPLVITPAQLRGLAAALVRAVREHFKNL